jgi:hypothetical protein
MKGSNRNARPQYRMTAVTKDCNCEPNLNADLTETRFCSYKFGPPWINRNTEPSQHEL